ncbi:MAG: hypothetical protein GY816_12115 [Cytophagales bacterium]|nr:hypothetical protein [Cytophagales bacterium]
MCKYIGTSHIFLYIHYIWSNCRQYGITGDDLGDPDELAVLLGESIAADGEPNIGESVTRFVASPMHEPPQGYTVQLGETAHLTTDER